MIAVGSRVRVTGGNAQGKTGIVRAIAPDGYCLVESEATGQQRRFKPDLLEVAALPPVKGAMPENGSTATPLELLGSDDLGSAATPHEGGNAPDLEAVLPSNGSTATLCDLQALRGQVAAALPLLEDLRYGLSWGHPLYKGWLNDEPHRMRYCHRNDKGEIVCTRVKSDELSGYRDRLQLGRVLAALDQVIRFAGGPDV
jgi:hypothetical protein